MEDHTNPSSLTADSIEKQLASLTWRIVRLVRHMKHSCTLVWVPDPTPHCQSMSAEIDFKIDSEEFQHFPHMGKIIDEGDLIFVRVYDMHGNYQNIAGLETFCGKCTLRDLKSLYTILQKRG